jgi:hypothetical protein
MNLERRDFLLVVTLAGAAATPAWGQTVARPAGGDAQISASIRIFPRRFKSEVQQGSIDSMAE